MPSRVGDLRRFLGRAEQRQAAVAEMIAGRPVVDEADDLVAELAMLEDLVGDQPAELAGSGDQDPLQPDAGAPSPLEHFAHELARRERQRDVQDDEDAPRRLRHFERAAAARGGAGEVGLHVQRGDDAEDDGEDAADEHGEEIVDPRSAAAQAIQPLQVEAERHEHRDERQHVDVLLKRRHAFGDRDEAGEDGVEAENVGEEERRDAEQRVRQHVKRDEQPVVAIYHAAGSAISAAISSPNRARLNCSA